MANFAESDFVCIAIKLCIAKQTAKYVANIFAYFSEQTDPQSWQQKLPVRIKLKKWLIVWFLHKAHHKIAISYLILCWEVWQGNIRWPPPTPLTEWEVSLGHPPRPKSTHPVSPKKCMASARRRQNAVEREKKGFDCFFSFFACPDCTERSCYPRNAHFVHWLWCMVSPKTNKDL